MIEKSMVKTNNKSLSLLRNKLRIEKMAYSDKLKKIRKIQADIRRQK